jgi:hypothetical protein
MLLAMAAAVLLVNLLNTLERLAACNIYGTSDACCSHGECKYKPSSDESRPVR